MTQPKRKKDERAELVKLFRTVLPGDFVKVLENGIQSIIEAELSSILGAEPYQRVEGRTNYRNGSLVSLYEGTCLKADRAREEQLHYQAGAYEER